MRQTDAIRKTQLPEYRLDYDEPAHQYSFADAIRVMEKHLPGTHVEQWLYYSREGDVILSETGEPFVECACDNSLISGLLLSFLFNWMFFGTLGITFFLGLPLGFGNLVASFVMIQLFKQVKRSAVRGEFDQINHAQAQRILEQRKVG